MSPAVKFTLGRLGLFVLVFVLLLPLPLNLLVSAMIALVVSFVLSIFLLADWRRQMGEQMAGASSRRTAEKERLRAALAGDEEAAAAGDRAAEPSPAQSAEPSPAQSAEPAEPAAVEGEKSESRKAAAPPAKGKN
jgi:Zn-dependent protease with chaperone function